MDPHQLERVLGLVRSYGAAAQLCVLRDGRVVLDRQFGCEADALFFTYSVSKPFVALLVHLLAERGSISLDDPVAEYWPEYARYGKQAITIRHVLAHRAGVPFATGTMVGDAISMGNWRRAVQQAEAARPRWAAGESVAYHMVTYGFILGELIRRVTGDPVRERLAADLLGPLGLRDTHLGLPAGLWSRRVPVTARGPRDRARTTIFNLRRTRQAVIPAAGISATARDLASFYQMLLARGRGAGVRVLEPATITEATRVSCDGEVDRVLGRPVRYGHGFQLGSPGAGRAIGRLASRETFGHNGSNICNAWADRASGLVVVYLTGRVTGRGEGARHHCQVSDAVRLACAG
jgi:CubicO group peptidase (beta-lactamase class C family)